MQDHEIKALREAETIEQVVAMVDCRGGKEQPELEQARLQFQYSNRILDGMPEVVALSHAKASVVHANGGTLEQQSEFWRAWHSMNRYHALTASF